MVVVVVANRKQLSPSKTSHLGSISRVVVGGRRKQSPPSKMSCLARFEGRWEVVGMKTISFLENELKQLVFEGGGWRQVVVVVGSRGGHGGPHGWHHTDSYYCSLPNHDSRREKKFCKHTFASAVLGGAGIKTTTSYENERVHSFL